MHIISVFTLVSFSFNFLIKFSSFTAVVRCFFRTINLDYKINHMNNEEMIRTNYFNGELEFSK